MTMPSCDLPAQLITLYKKVSIKVKYLNQLINQSIINIINFLKVLMLELMKQLDNIIEGRFHMVISIAKLS